MHVRSPFSSWRGACCVAALVGGALPACGDNQDDAGARDLLARAQASDYRQWARAPGYQSRRPSGAPHSEAVDIYVNPEVEAALQSAPSSLSEWPVGSIIVKDGWDGRHLELIAALEKREEGWFWAEYDSDGNPLYSGEPSICIDCHKLGSDRVRAFRLP